MDDSTKIIIEECIEKTRIKYGYKDGFFKPKLRGINHLEVGYSKIISNPITIILEFMYLVYKWIRDQFQNLNQFLFPRRLKIFTGRIDSYITGYVVHLDRKENREPIHNLKIELWGRTRWWQWRKFGETHTDEKGIFKLDFYLRSARNWKIRKLYAEIYRPYEIGYVDEDAFMKYKLYHRIRIKKNDLIGLGYNLGMIALPLWEYRSDVNMPRVFVPNERHLAPEIYDKGREDALIQQVLPIELTKQKHLFQIAKEPGILTIADIQNDYPENLTVCIEKKLPGYTRSDEWFGERMMNGMNKASFIPDPDRPGYSVVKIFGVCDYDHNNEYALPNVSILFKMHESLAPLPVEIELTGPLNALNRDRWQKRRFTPEDAPNWEYAKRIARTVGAVSAEADDHFAGTHVNTEQYAIACFRNFRLNPVAYLLFPHLKEVSLINHAADRTIIQGYLPTATALTAKGINQRVFDALGFQNWKAWKPMKIINNAHRFAKAENLFWELTGEFVDYFFQKYEKEIKEHWTEVYYFSRDLVKHSVPVFYSNKNIDKASAEEKSLYQERFEYGCKHYSYYPEYSTEVIDGEQKVITPITKTKIFEHEEDFQNLKDACRYAIMMATFSHTWINEHQYDDLGEILYNCGGLRFGEKESGVLAPESDLTIAPDLARSTVMLWFTNLLSRTEYGFITNNEEKDIHPFFIDILNKNKQKFQDIGVDIEAIESRTNI